jgi:hypothetical protein
MAVNAGYSGAASVVLNRAISPYFSEHKVDGPQENGSKAVANAARALE